MRSGLLPPAAAWRCVSLMLATANPRCCNPRACLGLLTWSVRRRPSEACCVESSSKRMVTYRLPSSRVPSGTGQKPDRCRALLRRRGGCWTALAGAPLHCTHAPPPGQCITQTDETGQAGAETLKGAWYRLDAGMNRISKRSRCCHQVLLTGHRPQPTAHSPQRRPSQTPALA
jgi:hypothetical protein